MATDLGDAVILIHLNCGEPVSVTVSHQELKDIPVFFIEVPEMADECNEPVLLSDDELIVHNGVTQYQALEETIERLEDHGLI